MNQDERPPALRAVQQQMAACRICQQAGYPITPRAVFSGRVGARIMVVGQAPGITEQETGRPFNAGSGRRLFAWLSAAGLEESTFRREQYMTSMTKCFPGRSPSGSGDRPPSRQELVLCRPYLLSELLLVDPQIVLPVGRVAITFFLGHHAALEEVVGQETPLDGRWVIPLPHPSGASRWHQIEGNRRKIDHAMRLLRRRLSRL
jgi:uracil-DNA glycosylase family 4